MLNNYRKIIFKIFIKKLNIIYEFLKVMLEKEFQQINQKIITPENTVVKNKKKKIRKKNIVVSA